MNSGLHLHRSERTDILVVGLAELLLAAPGDPFEQDVVAVPTRGIERFLAQSLSNRLGASRGRHDGVCANIAFPSLNDLVRGVVAQATGVDPDGDPWAPDRMVWRLLGLLDRTSSPQLAHYLRPGCEERRFAMASQLTRLFHNYASQRPELLLEWADLPGDLAWQRELWEQLRAEIGTPSPPERLLSACAAIAADPSLADLPHRISVFGPTRLPAAQLQVLRALATGREVHVWLATASASSWSSGEPAHPLLQTLGKETAHLRILLNSAASDVYTPSPIRSDTLLGALQTQIRDNAPIPGSAPADDSIQVHACHGAARQAEVVREAVLGLLQADPGLEPRDILILCPDLDVFAPLLSAAFSGYEQLRLRIADRTPEQSNEVLAALSALLSLADSRAPLSEVVDFAARPPVRAKFGLDDDALARLVELAAAAEVRWGLDLRTRADYKLLTPTGTWSWGLDRLLLGVALSEDELPDFFGMLPVDDVGSSDIPLLGSIADLIAGISAFRDAATGAHPLSHWVEILTGAITGLLDTTASDPWQVPNALAAVAAFLEHATDAELRLADIRWLLGEVLAGRPTRSNFRTGGLTACGMVPMRSVPHRVICLVGLDDGSFPRNGVRDGDDILARNPRPGERNPRDEDRQLFLDAIMSATEHLVITYTGADERTNEHRPPCAPLAELLDTIKAMTGRDIVVMHPLQPFDPRNFAADQPFSHDEHDLAAALTAVGPRREPGPFLTEDLAPAEVAELMLAEVRGFLTDPADALLRNRLGLGSAFEEEPPPEHIPLSLSGLERWEIGDRALALLLQGMPAPRVAAAEERRGALPPGALGSEIMKDIGTRVAGIAERVVQLREGRPGRQLGIRLAVGDVTIVGAVADVYGQRIVRATNSKAKSKHFLRLWPDLLAAAITEPHHDWSAHLVAEDDVIALIAPAPQRCEEILAELVALYLAGMRSPLPMAPEVSRAYAAKRFEGRGVDVALAAAERAWKDEAANTVFWASLSELAADPPRSDERWYPDEGSRFGSLSRRLWEPIIAAVVGA